MQGYNSKTSSINWILSKDYTLVPNYVLQDRGLSYEARGLYAYILSFPEDETFVFESIGNGSTDSYDVVKKALEELQMEGLVKKALFKERDSEPIIHWILTIPENV